MRADFGKRESVGDRDVRGCLRPLIAAGHTDQIESVGVVEEFTLPCATARADLVVVQHELVGYEIKSSRDTLRRLPSQVRAFERVFDRCWLVAATRHLDRAADVVSGSWGVIEILEAGDELRLIQHRAAEANPAVEVDLLVRLLWRDEVADAIRRMGSEPRLARGRGGMWAQLLDCADAETVQGLVRDALRNRVAWRGADGRSRVSLKSATAQ